MSQYWQNLAFAAAIAIGAFLIGWMIWATDTPDPQPKWTITPAPPTPTLTILDCRITGGLATNEAIQLVCKAKTDVP